MPALARLDGAHDLAVCEEATWGERSRGLGRQGVKDRAEGGHGSVSLPELTRCLVEKEDIIDESWHEESPYCRLSGLLERGHGADASSVAALPVPGGLMPGVRRRRAQWFICCPSLMLQRACRHNTVKV